MTSKLENYLAKELYIKYPHLSTRQNYRPDWMEGLELDFYIEEYLLAAEVQGNQHFCFVEFFHGSKDNFEKQKDRDAKKRIICRERQIKLIEIFTEKDADLFIELVAELDIKTIRKRESERLEKEETEALFNYRKLPELEQAVKKARRAIIRSKGTNPGNEFKHIARIVAKVSALCKINGMNIDVPEIVEFYKANKLYIQDIEEIHECMTCKEKSPKRKIALYGRLALQEHIRACHK